MHSDEFAKADHYRNFEDLVWIGEIEAWKYENGIHWGTVNRQRASGTATTDWLAMREHRAGGNVKTNAPFAVGEQVLVCCPSGEMDNGIIVCAIPQESATAADSTTDVLTLFDTGAAFMRVNLTSGDITIVSQKMNINVIGNASVRVSGYTQIISTGRMLVKSLTRLILQGPRKTIVL